MLRSEVEDEKLTQHPPTPIAVIYITTALNDIISVLPSFLPVSFRPPITHGHALAIVLGRHGRA